MFADENAAAAGSGPAEPQGGKLDVWNRVKEGILSASTEVPKTVVQHYVDKEIDSRVAKTIAAIDAATNLEGQIKRIKPDQESFNEAGVPVSATYTKAKVEERKKLQEKLDKVEAALLDAFNDNNFEKLKKLNLEGGDAARGNQPGSPAQS